MQQQQQQLQPQQIRQTYQYPVQQQYVPQQIQGNYQVQQSVQPKVVYQQQTQQQQQLVQQNQFPLQQVPQQQLPQNIIYSQQQQQQQPKAIHQNASPQYFPQQNIVQQQQPQQVSQAKQVVQNSQPKVNHQNVSPQYFPQQNIVYQQQPQQASQAKQVVQNSQPKVIQSIQPSQFVVPHQQPVILQQQSQIPTVLVASGKIIQKPQLQLGGVATSFLLKQNVDQRKKYQTPGLYGDFSKNTEFTREQLQQMKKDCEDLLEGKVSKSEHMQDAEFSYLTTYQLYNYKLAQQFKFFHTKKIDDVSVFQYSDKRESGLNAALGADNYAKQLAAIPENKFDFSKEGKIRTIKIYFYQQYEAPIVITYDDDGVIKTSDNNKDLVGLDILHYISCLMHADLSFVMKDKEDKVYYDFESELYQKVPKKQKFVGKDFMDFHDNAKTFGYVLKDLMPLMMKCWAQRLIDVIILDLRNYEIYQHKVFKTMFLKRTQRDHYYGAFDDDGNYIGIALYTYVYFQKLEQKELPYQGGEFFEFSKPEEFLDSFEFVPFDHEIYKKVAQNKY